MSVGMAEEIKKMNEGKDYDQGKLLAETERLMSGVKKDYEKSAFKAVFSGEAKLGLSRENLEKLSEYIARGIATKNYSLVENMNDLSEIMALVVNPKKSNILPIHPASRRAK